MDYKEALELLEQIVEYSSPKEDVIEKTISAATLRSARIKNKRYVPTIEASELRTRARFLKEACVKLEYELKAFISATTRHDKDEVLSR